MKQPACWVNAVDKDPNRKHTLILVVFPEGMVYTTDFQSLVAAVPQGDMKVKFELR